MAFKGLDQRFEERMNSIYGKYSLKKNNTSQPFLEFKPNDPNRNDTKNDSRLAPGASASRDFKRISLFLKSPAGARFLLAQAELQSGNAFSETRLYNPLFAFGRLQPNWVRIQRPLGSAKGEGIGAAGTQSTTSNAVGSFLRGLAQGSGADLSNQRSPGADSKIGGAGRLQKETASRVTDQVIGRSGPTGLLNLLPPNKITRIASAAKNILSTGILDVNQRPELNLDGQYFSIAMWTGFKRAQPEVNSFAKAGVAARKGDIKGAIKNIGQGILNTVEKAILPTKGSPIPQSAVEGRNDPSRTDLNGLRYFIVNQSAADRYLPDSIHDGKPSAEFLDRLPYQLSGDSVLFSDLQSSNIRTPIGTVPTAEKTALKAQSKTKNVLSKIGGFVKNTSSALFGGNSIPGIKINLGPTNPTTGRLIPGSQTNNPFAQNPAEERLLFGELSLANKYENADGDVASFKDNLDTQKTQWTDSIKKLRTDPSYGIGYIGGLTPGDPIVDDFGIFAAKRMKSPDGRYFSDQAAASMDAILVNKTTNDQNTGVHVDLKNTIRAAYKDTIDFMFHDFTNDRVIPFRAILAQISENTNAEFNIQKYVGRTERNVVYTGAARDLSFAFQVYAFNKNEMDFIWQKINYLTGLCFPASYSDGFMVPPFVQMTIGNLYVDQPGYIKSVSYTIDDNTTWEIDRDIQMPMGITVTVNFSVVEKSQVRAGFPFYGFGEPQWVGKNNGS